MVPDRACAAHYGIYIARLNHRFLRGRGLDSGACLPYYRYWDKYPISDIHTFFGVVTAVLAEMAEGGIYGAR